MIARFSADVYVVYVFILIDVYGRRKEILL